MTGNRLLPISVLVAALIATSAGCDPTPPTPDRPTATAVLHTTRGDLVASLDASLDGGTAGAFRNLAAVVVTVDGRTVYERYNLMLPTDTTNIDSVGKTILGTLIVIALADGTLRGLDQPLAELLPDYRKDMSAQVAGITLEQLLTMRAGLLPDGEFYPQVTARRQDWVRFILRHRLASAPGQQFAYSSAGSHLLSAILSEATGRSVLAYAREKLFDPLGIVTTPANELRVTDGRDLSAYAEPGFAWPTDPQGRHLGGGAQKLTAPDLARLGQLWLNRGRWNGRQVVPADWSDRMQKQQVDTEGASVGSGYGYQQWVGEADGHRAIMATGNGGQLVEVVPDLGLVVVFLSAVAFGAGPADLVGIADSGTYASIVDTRIVPRVS